MSERMRSPFSIVSEPPNPVEYVSLLGTTADKDGGSATTLAFAGVSIVAGESIFLGLGFIASFPNGVIAVTDNLGNVYSQQSGVFPGAVEFGTSATMALWAAIPSIVGTISQINITTVGHGGSCVAIAARFRNVGVPVTATPLTAFGINEASGPREVLQTAGPAAGVGVGVYGVTTTGTPGYDIGTAVGQNSTSGGSDASNIMAVLGYASPVTASGIRGYRIGGQNRVWGHAGRSYDGYNPWP